MEYTENLHLKKPSATDPVNIQDFNDNFDHIDSLDGRVSNLMKELTENPNYAPTAEVVDIRSGYDGSTYDTAGDAVRSLGYELEDVRNELQKVNPDDLGLEQDEETGLVYITFRGVRSINGIPLASRGGGNVSNSGSVLKVRDALGTTAFTAALGSTIYVSYTFSSTDITDGTPTGNGTASYYIDDNLVGNVSIEQGTIIFDCSAYMNAGTNEVKVVVTDVDGNSRPLKWTIECIEIRLTSTFDYTLAYDGDITYKFTSYGDAEKTIHFVVDGVEQSTTTVTASGRQSTQILPAMSHGVHVLDVYASAYINGSYVESNHLVYDVICKKENSVTPIISVNCDTKSVKQGEIIDLPFIVYDPLATESTVTLSIDHIVDGVYRNYSTSTRNVDRSLQHWSTRQYPVGTVRFTVTLRNISRSHEVNVAENILPIEPTTTDLELFLSSAGRSNSELNPAVWTYGDVTTEFHNVNWSSSGWLQDNVGDTALRLAAGTSATINFQPFAKDLRLYGKTLEFEFAVRDINRRDANVISCKSGDIGLEITADNASLKSKLNSVGSRYTANKKLRVTFVIESRAEYRMMSVYLNGVLTHTQQYVETDDFQQISPVNIEIGSPYCAVDLYTVRSYDTALNHEELLNNYICDIVDVFERSKVYEANDIYDAAENVSYEKVKKRIPVATIIGPLPTYKGDKKDVVVRYEDFRDSSKNFELPCSCDVQGTSSQGYVRKNYKWKFKQYITHMDGELPAKVFCVKADYAEATSTHNTQNANLVETLYNDKTPAQEDDPRCRTTITGFPIVIFHQDPAVDESGNYVKGPEFLGKYNFNYDKGSEDIFGFTDDYDVECWEFKNNESICNFVAPLPENYSEKSESGFEIGWTNDFERRYPDNDDPMDETAIARFRIIHDWVHSTAGLDANDPEAIANFREEFEERFNLHKCLIYYVYTFIMLMTDQRAKNMFFTYWGETGKWEPWFYDNDTCLGIDNYGNLTFDYYLEDTDLLHGSDKIFNGQDSIFFNNMRIAYPEEIAQTYRDLRDNNKLSYEIAEKYFVEGGSDKWSAAMYNEDSDFKYISMLRSENDASNLYQVKGTGEFHLDYWLGNRFPFCDSKWFASAYATDYVEVRIYTPVTWGGVEPSANITVTPFSHMYTGVRYRRNGALQQVKAASGESVTFSAPSSEYSEAETTIYGASQLSSIGDLAPLYCGYINAAKATRLIELKIGSGEEGYSNTYLNDLQVGTNRLLKKIDIQNCPNLTAPLNLAGCPNIEEIYATGSGITGVQLPNSGYLKKIYLPGTITDLTIKNQSSIEEFEVTSYDNIKTIWVENSVGIPVPEIVLNATSLERARIINMNWECTEEELSALFNKLKNCGGIDETGINSASAVVTGIVSVPSISSELLDAINVTFPELMISVDGVVMCTVSFFNEDGTLLYIASVERGSSVEDPVLAGIIDEPVKENTEDRRYEFIGWSDSLENIQKSRSLVATYKNYYLVSFFNEDVLLHSQWVSHGEDATDPIGIEVETPVKESTAQYDYEYAGWDISLEYVTDVRNLHVVFNAILRSYEVSFYNDDIFLYSVTLPYGTEVIYEGETPTKQGVEYPEDYEFIGWVPALSIVTGPTTYHAQYAQSGYITDDWDVISENVASGLYKTIYQEGILKRLTLTHEDGTEEIVEMELVGFDHDDLADGSGKAGITFICKNLPVTEHVMNTIGVNRPQDATESWESSAMREYLTTTVYASLPEKLKSLILPVIKKTSIGRTSEIIAESSDTLWIPSIAEISSDYNNDSRYPVYAAEGETYPVFTDNDSRIKCNNAGYPIKYWTRSPVLNSSTFFWFVTAVGGFGAIYAANTVQGVAFGFCIGKPDQ